MADHAALAQPEGTAYRFLRSTRGVISPASIRAANVVGLPRLLVRWGTCGNASPPQRAALTRGLRLPAVRLSYDVRLSLHISIEQKGSNAVDRFVRLPPNTSKSSHRLVYGRSRSRVSGVLVRNNHPSRRCAQADALQRPLAWSVVGNSSRASATMFREASTPPHCCGAAGSTIEAYGLHLALVKRRTSPLKR